jgi:small redox-active disulfide protein 2
MKFIIYGSGCSKCQLLAERLEQAASALNISYELEKITAVNQIIAEGIMRTPALVVDGDIILEGKVVSSSELQALLTKLT